MLIPHGRLRYTTRQYNITQDRPRYSSSHSAARLGIGMMVWDGVTIAPLSYPCCVLVRFPLCLCIMSSMQETLASPGCTELHYIQTKEYVIGNPVTDRLQEVPGALT